jgi:hypothetical protein
MVFVYPLGIPFMYLVLCFLRRNYLNPNALAVLIDVLREDLFLGNGGSATAANAAVAGGEMGADDTAANAAAAAANAAAGGGELDADDTAANAAAATAAAAAAAAAVNSGAGSPAAPTAECDATTLEQLRSYRAHVMVDNELVQLVVCAMKLRLLADEIEAKAIAAHAIAIERQSAAAAALSTVGDADGGGGHGGGVHHATKRSSSFSARLSTTAHTASNGIASRLRNIKRGLEQSLHGIAEQPDSHVSDRWDAFLPGFKEVVDELRTAYSTVEGSLVSRYRLRDSRISDLTFLFEAYEPRCWYWESVECMRRLMLTGLLVFVPAGILQIVVASLIAMAFMVIYGAVSPFIDPTADKLATFAQARLACRAARFMIDARPLPPNDANVVTAK